MWMIFSSRILASEEAVACLPGKALTQWKRIHTDGYQNLCILMRWEKLNRVHFPNLNDSSGNLKCPGAVQTGFPGFSIGRVGQVKYFLEPC